MKMLMRVWLVAGLLAGVCRAEDSPIAGPPTCRFLFYVDSSKGMSRWSSAAATTVSHLVATGVSGRMRPGDAFAVWHYNEEPFQFEFPIRVWTPEKAEALGREVGIFLRKLRYDRGEQPGLAMREMYLAMGAVESLTVVLVSNGETAVVGTPFDVAINKAFFERGDDVRQKRLPMLTTLYSVNKKVVTWAVTVGKEEVVLAELAGTVSGRVAELPVAASVPVATGIREGEAPVVGLVEAGARPAAFAPTVLTPAVPTVPTVPVPVVPVPVATPVVGAGVVQTVAVPAPATVVSPTAPKVNPGARILDIFAIPFAQAPGLAATTGAVAAPTAGGSGGNAVAAAAVVPTVGAPTVGAPTVGAPMVGGGLFGAGSGGLVSSPTNLLRIVGTAPGTARLPGAEAVTNAGAGSALAMVPVAGMLATNAGAASSPLSVLRINPARTNLPGLAEAGTNAAGPRAGVEFARKSAPSFAGEVGRGNSAGSAPTVAAGGGVEKRPATGGATVATNLAGKPLAAIPVLVDENPRARPVQFLVAGVITLGVAAWFGFLLWRGARPRNRTSISRAMDK